MPPKKNITETAKLQKQLKKAQKSREKELHTIPVEKKAEKKTISSSVREGEERYLGRVNIAIQTEKTEENYNKDIEAFNRALENPQDAKQILLEYSEENPDRETIIGEIVGTLPTFFLFNFIKNFIRNNSSDKLLTDFSEKYPVLLSKVNKIREEIKKKKLSQPYVYNLLYNLLPSEDDKQSFIVSFSDRNIIPKKKYLEKLWDEWKNSKLLKEYLREENIKETKQRSKASKKAELLKRLVDEEIEDEDIIEEILEKQEYQPEQSKVRERIKYREIKPVKKGEQITVGGQVFESDLETVGVSRRGICVDKLRIANWFGQVVKDIWITSVDNSDISKFVSKNVEKNSRVYLGAAWIKPNSYFFSILCNRDSIQTQKDDVFTIKINDQEFSFSIGYQTASGFHVQNEEIFNRYYQFIKNLREKPIEKWKINWEKNEKVFQYRKCVETMRTIPWMKNYYVNFGHEGAFTKKEKVNISGIEIKAVNKGENIDDFIEKKGEFDYIPNDNFYGLLCEQYAQLSVQSGNIFRLFVAPDEYIDLYIFYIVIIDTGNDENFGIERIIQDEEIFKLYKNYITDLHLLDEKYQEKYKSRQAKIETYLSGTVTDDITRIASVKLVERLHSLAPDVEDYGTVIKAKKYGDDVKEDIINYNTEFIKKAIAELPRTSALEFIRKLAELLVFLTPPLSNIGSQIFIKRVQKEYYLPETLVNLTVAEKLPEVFDVPFGYDINWESVYDSNDLNRIKLENIIVRQISRFISNFGEELYSYHNPSDRIPPRPTQTFYEKVDVKEWKSVCENVDNVKDTLSEKIVYYQENDKTYCLDIGELQNQMLFDEENPVNPYTNNPLSQDFIDKFKKTYITGFNSEGYIKTEEKLEKKEQDIKKEKPVVLSEKAEPELAPGLMEMIMLNIKDCRGESTENDFDGKCKSMDEDIKGECYYCRKSGELNKLLKSKILSKTGFETVNFCSVNCFEKQEFNKGENEEEEYEEEEEEVIEEKPKEKKKKKILKHGLIEKEFKETATKTFDIYEEEEQKEEKKLEEKESNRNKKPKESL